MRIRTRANQRGKHLLHGSRDIPLIDEHVRTAWAEDGPDAPGEHPLHPERRERCVAGIGEVENQLGGSRGARKAAPTDRALAAELTQALEELVGLTGRAHLDTD